MIILTKEILDNNEIFSNALKNEKTFFNNNIEHQKALKNIFLDYMQKLVDCTDNVDLKDADIVINFLNDFKNSLELFNTNINLLNSLIASLDNVTSDFETINIFNTTFMKTNETVSKNTLQIEKVLGSIIPYLNFTFQENSINTVINVESIVQANSTIIENTLIISEQRGKVFLPYTVSSLNNTLKNYSDKYSNIEEIIEKEYTLPFDLFKNPAVARFREAFKLVRKKENQSIKEAFDLGMELLFNYNLHPAIISACKNLDELDIYLDYLENNETHKFDCFKIVFEVAPVVVKNPKRS